jgi:hypothetical protein
LAYEDLNGAVAMGLELSIADMKERGIVPNRTTFDALDDLRAYRAAGHTGDCDT